MRCESPARDLLAVHRAHHRIDDSMVTNDELWQCFSDKFDPDWVTLLKRSGRAKVRISINSALQNRIHPSLDVARSAPNEASIPTVSMHRDRIWI